MVGLGQCPKRPGACDSSERENKRGQRGDENNKKKTSGPASARERTREERERDQEVNRRRRTSLKPSEPTFSLPCFSTPKSESKNNLASLLLFSSRCPLSPLKRRLGARKRDKESHLRIEISQQQCSLEPLGPRKRQREMSRSLARRKRMLHLPLQQPEQQLSRCLTAPATSKLSRSSWPSAESEWTTGENRFVLV